MSKAYYNEFDPFAAAWLRELIKAGEIADGEVDERSIKDVQPNDLKGFTQCHFFAGIGGWSYAARLAGWPDGSPIWTGSCPCQPFSAAGKRGGEDDARHLWPDFFRLITACGPSVVVGEQVAGAPGYGWFDGVRSDLAGENYACRGIDIPACAVDAPHIRQRLYWVALANSEIGQRWAGLCESAPFKDGNVPANRDGCDGILADDQRNGRRPIESRGRSQRGIVAGRDFEGDLEYSNISIGRISDKQSAWKLPEHEQESGVRVRGASRNGSFWTGSGWIECHDGKARRTESGVPLLAHGIPNRVGQWRGFGNAIVPQIGAEVIASLMDTMGAAA